MEKTVNLELIPVVIAVVEFLKKAPWVPFRLKGAVTIVAAALVGAVFGWFNGDLAGGAYAGLAAAGFVAGVKQFGK